MSQFQVAYDRLKVELLCLDARQHAYDRFKAQVLGRDTPQAAEWRPQRRKLCQKCREIKIMWKKAAVAEKEQEVTTT